MSVAPSEAGATLSLERVSRSYGPVVALAPLTLHLGQGTVCAVQGANGSGKTTLLRLAAGTLAPTTGRRLAKGQALYLRTGDAFRDAESPRQAVDFARAATRGDADVGRVLDAVGLADMAEAPSAILSAGQRARVTLAVAAACRVDVVCLDEPTAHLDTDGRVVARHIVQELASRDVAVLVASHDMHLLGGIADARIELRNGVAEAESW